MTAEFTPEQWDAFCAFLRARTVDRAEYRSSSYILTAAANTWVQANGYPDVAMPMSTVVAMIQRAGYGIQKGKTPTKKRRLFAMGIGVIPESKGARNA
ncbi:hypothetical protein [Streptomyces sp. NRRL WC-3549]|uniref:hypothetical protein n=1 Tax=Streptomyces sp. NRRL WC-3549 TaxID=1463925 RepID=UPI00131E5ADE|nr:hypothetical protein [Streptomyces sp. NRRL WC-3549]